MDRALVSEPRVLQVVLSLNPGGTERLVMELASRLNATMPTMVCCLDEEGSWAAEMRGRGVDVIALGRQPGFRPGLARRVKDVVSSHRATVIHAHHYSPFVYSALSRVWGARAPVIYTEHGRLSDAPPSPKRRIANKIFARAAGGVYTVSADLRHHLVGEGFAPERIGVIYNGIDIDPLPDQTARRRVREQLGADGATFVMATIARLDPVKDLGTMVLAVAEMSRARRVMGVIIGDGSERATLEKMTHALGVADQFRFLGHRNDARTWLAGCDAYVNSSISEGASLTIIEAMAAGLPVVATRVGGTPEVVEESCGRLVPARDAAALAAALLGLASDPATRASLGLAARARAESRFTLNRMVAEYADVYRRLVRH